MNAERSDCIRCRQNVFCLDVSHSVDNHSLEFQDGNAFWGGVEMRGKNYVTAVLLCLVVALNGLSRSTSAMVGGTVQDSTGAFIPGVTVTATNTGTGIVTTVLSNEAGAYQFASLQPGSYEIKAELPGFQTAIVKDFQLGGAQQARLNFTLQVAAAAGTT